MLAGGDADGLLTAVAVGVAKLGQPVLPTRKLRVCCAPEQDTWAMLAGGDADGRLTAVAVGVAKLGEPAVLAVHKDASSFVGTGRALSVAAGRLSYIHGLKVNNSQGLGYKVGSR